MGKNIADTTLSKLPKANFWWSCSWWAQVGGYDFVLREKVGLLKKKNKKFHLASFPIFD